MRTLLLYLCLALAGSAVADAEVPSATLDNGVLHAIVYLPDTSKGFYRGTRFDWSGVIANLTFAGHSYYGPWFTKQDPSVRDFIFKGPDIIAGSCSSITGPAEEFVSPLGFDQTTPGQTFVKIGVGVLRRPDDQKYDMFRQYQIVDSGQWTVEKRTDSIRFVQRLSDPKTGYAYLYTKELRVLPNKPVLAISHMLKNVGRLPIETNVYNHNFLVLDRQPTGPNFSIVMPFTIKPEGPIKQDLGEVTGNKILYRRPLQGTDVFTVHIGGFSQTPKDYDIRIENRRLGVGLRITGDHPLEKEELWSIRSILAIEPFVHLAVAPGETVKWSHSYRYYTLNKTQ